MSHAPRVRQPAFWNIPGSRLHENAPADDGRGAFLAATSKREGVLEAGLLAGAALVAYAAFLAAARLA